MHSQLRRKPKQAKRDIGEAIVFAVGRTAALYGLAALIGFIGVSLPLALLMSAAILALGVKIALS